MSRSVLTWRRGAQEFTAWFFQAEPEPVIFYATGTGDGGDEQEEGQRAECELSQLGSLLAAGTVTTETLVWLEGCVVQEPNLRRGGGVSPLNSTDKAPRI